MTYLLSLQIASQVTEWYKQWRTIFLVLRPGFLSIYRNADETKLRHKLNLSELSAVARQKDPKRKDKHVFGLFSPSRNFHLEAKSAAEATEWVELIRREARIDEAEDEMILASPGGANSTFRGFERSIDAHVGTFDERGGYSSSDMEAFSSPHPPPAKARQRVSTNVSTASYIPAGRRTSAAHTVEYSGAEGAGSYSDFSDSGPAARLSALSLSYTDGRPSTSSTQQPSTAQERHHVYMSQAPPTTTATMRPSMGARNQSQMSNLNAFSADSAVMTPGTHFDDSDRVTYHGWMQLLKTKSGVRQWKKVWMVLRPKALAIYKNEEEYSALLVIPFKDIIEVVEIDPVSKSKEHCMQLISQERNYRFCALDEESLARWLGAFKSLLNKRKVALAGKEAGEGRPVAVGS